MLHDNERRQTYTYSIYIFKNVNNYMYKCVLFHCHVTQLSSLSCPSFTVLSIVTID